MGACRGVRCLRARVTDSSEHKMWALGTKFRSLQELHVLLMGRQLFSSCAISYDYIYRFTRKDVSVFTETRSGRLILVTFHLAGILTGKGLF